MPSADQAIRRYAGRFAVSRERERVTLEAEQGGLTLLFTDAVAANLPAAVEQPQIVPAQAPAAAGRCRFELVSGEGSWPIEARSLQIHEPVALYGSVIELPRFATRQRAVWTLLLWIARFRWGQQLLRRLTRRKAPDEP